jgi:hypothetical protein
MAEKREIEVFSAGYAACTEVIEVTERMPRDLARVSYIDVLHVVNCNLTRRTGRVPHDFQS